MNVPPRASWRAMVPLAAAVAAAGLPAGLRAQTDGAYSNAGGGSWALSANWSGGAIASGPGALADFSLLNLTAARIVTLDGSRTIGRLRFGDAVTVSHDQTLGTGVEGPLVMDAAAGRPTIEILNRTATIGLVLSGDKGLALTNGGGPGGTVMLNAANTFTGGLEIAGAIVQFNNNAAGNTGAGVNPIHLMSAAASSRLVINGGVSTSCPVLISADLAGVAGFGALQQTGSGPATLTGALTIDGNVLAGGHFVGGTAAGNALVLNGPVTATVPLVQRSGFVRYGGAGSDYDTLFVSQTALLGAANGISPGAVVNLGPSLDGTLDLNGFDQTLAGLRLGFHFSPTAYSGIVNLGPRTLTMEGDIQTGALAPAGHRINATTGAINVGTTGRNLIVGDTPQAEDLIITNAALNGSGGFFKAGSGTVALNGTTGNAPFFLDAGGLAIGRLGQAGTFALPALTLGNGTTLHVDAGPGGDLAHAGVVTFNGVANVAVNQLGGALAPGLYPFLAYSGGSPGTAGFHLLPVGHSTASLEDTGSAIALRITANQRLTWHGGTSGQWSTAPQHNWKLGPAAADYIEGDDVIFPGTAFRTAVELAQPVYPSRVTFTNQAPANYTITATGGSGIGGAASLIKEGSGRTALRLANSYLGGTEIREGILELDHDVPGNTVLSGTAGVLVAEGATLRLTRDDGGLTFAPPLTGEGTLEINPHGSLGGAGAHGVVLGGDNSGFSGPVRLLEPLSGTFRLTSVTPSQLGIGPVVVSTGSQVYTAASRTYPNAIVIDGIGYRDSGGNIGALRLEGGSVWAGPVTVAPGGARIGCYNGTAVVAGGISGGDLNVNGSDGTFNVAHTVILTGANSYGKTVVGGGSTATAVSSRRLNIGNGGTSGTLGTGGVLITGDGQNGILGFDRLDGYTLGVGQTISGTGPQPGRVFVDIDVLGSGFRDNGNSITLGNAGPGAGGTFRVAQTRAGATATLTGNFTAQTLAVATGQTNGVLNFGNGANVRVNLLTAGESAGNSGSIQQTDGSRVEVAGQVRVGHYGTNTSSYFLNGGTLELTGSSPVLNPSTAGPGSAGNSGDNNINAAAVPVIEGGGIYLGVDGTGIFHQAGGVVRTNWVVLDNRGQTGAGPNMPDGQDEYRLEGGILVLRSTWGVRQRNASAGFRLAGGTVRVENSGNGFGTGAALTIPLDAALTVHGSGSVLDTNGPGNTFALPRSLLGTGTLGLTGGGAVKFNPDGLQMITAVLSGSGPVIKEGPGTTILAAEASGLTGPVSVAAGRLDLPASAAPASLTLAEGAALAAEVSTPSLVLNGGTLLFDPTTSGALNAASLTVNGPVLLDFSKSPVGDGSWTVINYGNRSGSGTFAVTGGAGYRNITVTDTGSAIVVTLAGTRALTWGGTGGPGTPWDVNLTSNWSSAGTDSFRLGDRVLFDDSAVQTQVSVGVGVAPGSTRINATSLDYSFTTTGTGIGGTGPLIKEGGGTLTLSGPNGYGGRTEIHGGTLGFSAAQGLGGGGTGNSILIANGGRLEHIGDAAVDLGINRDLEVGTGGAVVSHRNAAAATITVPGRITGNQPISFQSAGSGAGLFILTGDNSGYTGPITVDAPTDEAGGLTVLRLAEPQAVPSAGSITLNYPAAGTANGSAVTLDLANVSLPAPVSVNLTSHQGAVSLRTQVTSSGNSAINGPVQLGGSGIVQFSPSSGSLSLNGPITEAAGGFPNVMFLRGAGGTGFVNGQVHLPGATLAKTDGNTWTVHGTGNHWARTSVLAGTLSIGSGNALPATAPLVLGQNDGNAAQLNLNGFDQTVAGLSSNPAVFGANTTGKAVTSSLTSVFTVNQSADGTYAGLITGNVSLVKQGNATLTLAGPGTFTGNVEVMDGLLQAGGTAVTSLGHPGTEGRIITVTAPGRLQFSTNNVYGNGVDNHFLPATVVEGTTLKAVRYNVLGPVILRAGTLLHDVSDSGGFEGFQFRGNIAVEGMGMSVLASGNGKSAHLGPVTVFAVGDAAVGALTDLRVSSPLRDQSDDFGSAAGSLIKAGEGTMELLAASTYTGGTSVLGGVLLAGNSAGSATGSGPVSVQAGGTLSGSGAVAGMLTVQPGGSVSPGSGTGSLSVGAVVLSGLSTVDWQVSDWAGLAGSGYDTLQATALGLTATPAAPVRVKVDASGLVNFVPGPAAFVLVSAAGGITGFDPAAFWVDAGTFTAATGSWAVTQQGSQLLLNFSPGPVDSYQLWADFRGLSGFDRAPGADPDGDGLGNFAEFALNSDPWFRPEAAAMPHFAVLSAGGHTYPTLTLPVREDIVFSGGGELSGIGSGIRYRLQGDTGLNAWDAPMVEVSPALSAGLPLLDPGWSYRTFRPAAPITPGTRQFMRVRLEWVP